MPSNFTQNYNLNQWESTDRVLRTDFNADNAKIDAALTAQTETLETEKTAREAADAALSSALALKGNCQIYVTTYVGTGKYGRENSTRITFPARPVLFFISRPNDMYPFVSVGTLKAGIIIGGINLDLTWNGNTVSFYNSDPAGQFNDLNDTYTVVAFLPADS